MHNSKHKQIRYRQRISLAGALTIGFMMLLGITAFLKAISV